MLKSEGVVILMEKIIQEVEFLTNSKFESVENLLKQTPQEVFSEQVQRFFGDLSSELLKSTRIKDFPDVATFAFYCRNKNLSRLARYHHSKLNKRLGRGIVFHVTPTNVPVNFAYSLLAGLITGNINIVRVPSENFEQVQIIVNAINKILLNKYFKDSFSNRLYLIRYNRDSQATAFFSSFCDVRIIWGGDETINRVRKSPLPPRSIELTFSDRYSVCVIKADGYLKIENKDKVALDFYNDTYLFDQNACTSPQSIFWIGSNDKIERAQQEFWKYLEKTLILKNFKLQPIIAVDKLTTFYSQAISRGDIEVYPSTSNQIWRVKNEKVNGDIERFKCSSGYFNEINIQSLDNLMPIINRKLQTLGYLGFTRDEMEFWVNRNNLIGIDRVVPIGRTMDFELIWDGYDLVSSLTRTIVIN